MKIAMMVHEGFFPLALGALLDIFRVAEMVREEIDPGIAPIELRLAGTAEEVTGPGGVHVRPDCGPEGLQEADLVLVPALGTVREDQTRDLLDTPAVRDLIDRLARPSLSDRRFAAACTGTFVLAASGRLDGRRATTTWFQAPLFRTLYPRVDLDMNEMVVADGPCLTAGAAFAHVDLALAVLRGISLELAEAVARLLLIDARPSQARFVLLDHLQHRDPIVRAFERAVREGLEEPLEIATLARQVGASRRSLERRCRAVYGQSPLQLVQAIRLERAEHLSRTTTLSTAEIAHRVGYANAETLRALRRRRERGDGRVARRGGEGV